MTLPSTLPELERLYAAAAPALVVPRGNFVGTFLCWLPTEGARRWHIRLASGLLFQRTRFGVDFDRRVWWFVDPRLAAGRFSVTPGASRWRECQTLRLEYGASRLVGLRDLLYDEVRPLSPDLCLGIGGVNAARGQGDHFFFALQRI